MTRRRLILTVFIGVVTGLLFSGVLHAHTSGPTKNFLMWQFPASLPFPVYVYQNGQQVGYIATPESQSFVGQYPTNAQYTLYYKGPQNWHACTLSFQGTTVSGIQPAPCPGVVINKPASAGAASSNVYTVAFGATPWLPTISGSVPPPPVNPTAPNYASRSVTFTNKTTYPEIKISGSYCTSFALKCPKTAFKQIISTKTPYVFKVPLTGINSAAFYMTDYCAGNCKSAKSWVSTGGYGVGETPYATKIEFTFLPVNNGVPTGASNADISSVDGFNAAVRLAPASSTYCIYTVPPENSNLLGAGFYGSSQPLAKLVSTGAGSLQTMCAGSSQLYAGYKGARQPWPLSVQSGGQFLGCRSPCSYSTKNGEQDMPQFCCAAPYDTPASCIVPSGTVGANTSTYVANILSSKQFQNVYPFGYGDAGSDYGCPAETSFVVTFT